MNREQFEAFRTKTLAQKLAEKSAARKAAAAEDAAASKAVEELPATATDAEFRAAAARMKRARAALLCC